MNRLRFANGPQDAEKIKQEILGEYHDDSLRKAAMEKLTKTDGFYIYKWSSVFIAGHLASSTVESINSKLKKNSKQKMMLLQAVHLLLSVAQSYESRFSQFFVCSLFVILVLLVHVTSGLLYDTHHHAHLDSKKTDPLLISKNYNHFKER